MTNTAHLTPIVSVARTYAGSDFRWTTYGAPSALRSDHIRGLTALLADAQGGVCAACGDALGSERVELCHIVASRRGGYGIMPGNVYVGHVGCNSDDDKVFSTDGGVLALESLVRPDVVQVEHPTRQACLAADAATRDMREARRARRAALMG